MQFKNFIEGKLDFEESIELLNGATTALFGMLGNEEGFKVATSKLTFEDALISLGDKLGGSEKVTISDLVEHVRKSNITYIKQPSSLQETTSN